MSDEHFEDDEYHTPEEWVALLGLPQPVLESVPEWGPHTEQCYETDKVTRRRFVAVYETAIQHTAEKPSFDLRDCQKGGIVHIWFVGDGELKIMQRSDSPVQSPLRPQDVQLTPGRMWEKAVKKPRLSSRITHASIGERLSLIADGGCFTTPKIKRIVIEKGDER